MQSIRECCANCDAADLKLRAAKLARRFMPVLTWGPQLNRRKLIADCVGGFIAGVMVVPTCLSWASLAGLDLSCGLSAALMASVSYGTFGSCAVLSIGPVAEITTLLISISGIPTDEREKTYQSIGVQVGILSVLLSFFDGGKVIKTIFAKPVGDGYTCAAALLAICVQLKVMFNVTAPAATLIQDVLFQTIKALIQQFSVNCIYSFLLFMVYCLYLIYIKKTRLPLWIPHQLIVVVASILVTSTFKLYSEDSLHLAIVGNIPAGLKAPSFPPWKNMIGLGPYTLTITMISFVQMYVIAQRVMPNINPNAELFASGVTNFLCNVFGGMPVTNSFSVSSVLLEQHVNTPLTAYAAAGILFITMMFLTRLGLFYYLPKQALGAIVVASVWRLVDFSGPMNLWRYSKKDAAVWIFTFVLTIFGGITVGVLGGIALSLIIVVLRVARPRAVTVGFNMSTFRYGDISHDPELLVYPNILLWRFDAPLYFVNTGYFQEKLIKAIHSEVRPIDVVLVTCGKIVDIDAAALVGLPTMLKSVSLCDPTQPRRIILCDIHGRLEKVLLESEALPMYVPEEYDRLAVSQMESMGKFPVVFKRLEDAIAFAQRCISERYGNVDTAPYPNVSFLTDLVVAAAKMTSTAGGGAALATIAMEDAGGGVLNPASGPDAGDWGQRDVRGGDRDGADSPTTTGQLSFMQLAYSMGGVGISGDAGSATGPSSNTNMNLLLALDRLKKLSTFSPDRELIGVVGVVRHTEVTPRQKEKIIITDRELIRLALKPGGDLTKSRRSLGEMDGLFHAVDEQMVAGVLEHAEGWRRVVSVARSNPPGLKLKVKVHPVAMSEGSFNSLDGHPLSTLEPRDVSDVRAVRFVLKWGGVPTRSGIAQAHVLGEKLFARFYAAGDLPLRRLLTFTRNPRVFSSDDSRVISTALEVVNALTQSGSISKEDIIVDDGMMKTLSTTAKRLLHDEYKYFEALMHINSHAAARHYFHIPGFRQLLLIPPLERPLQLGRGGMNDGALSEGEFAGGDNSYGGFPGSSVENDGEARDTKATSMMHDSATGFDDLANDAMTNAPWKTDISFFHGSRALSSANALSGARRLQQQSVPLSSSDFYTPLEAIRELERHLRVIVETDFPAQLLRLPLSNHETFRELRQRYDTMLRILRGSKFRQNASTRTAVAGHRRHAKKRGSSDDDDDNDDDNDDGNDDGNGNDVSGAAGDAGESGGKGRSCSSAGREVELDVVGGSSDEGDANDTQRLSAHDSDNSSNSEGDQMMEEISSPQRRREADNSDGTSPWLTGPSASALTEASSSTTTADGLLTLIREASPLTRGSRSRTPMPMSPSVDGASPATRDPIGAADGQSLTGGGSARPRRAVSARQSREKPTRVGFAPLDVPKLKSQVACGDHGGRRAAAAAAAAQEDAMTSPPRFAPRITGTPTYDLSDISKLRDYGSYDLSYNIHLLKGLHAATHMFEVRRLIDSLLRTAHITECMSRVGENVLEGVNSSKRFIIGSLVSGGLLKRILGDYTEFAKMDERKGVTELLLRAQSLYMAEKSGVEQDVQHFMRLFRKLGKKSERKEVRLDPFSNDEQKEEETPDEREFRLKFPFISLPKEEPLRRDGANVTPKPQGSSQWRRPGAGSTVDDEESSSCARFYFTTYLHVEGLLQCLFENMSVDGFSRPSKEELEESQQLYMKHLIFKVFRRRNVSFTDAEALAGFRKLNLLFRSDVDYARQQRELRAALSALYHAIYYISMEVYLSLGDSEGVSSNEANDALLVLADGGYDGSSPFVTPTGVAGGSLTGMVPGSVHGRAAPTVMVTEDGRVIDTSDGTSDDEDGEDEASGSTEGASSQRTNSPKVNPRRMGVSVPPTPVPGLAGRGMGSPFPAAADGHSSSCVSGSPPSGVFGRTASSPLPASPTRGDSRSVTFAPSPLLEGSIAGSSPMSSTLAVPVRSSGAADSPLNAPLPPPKKKCKRHHDSKKAATVLTTPQAGRGAAMVQEMKNRVSSVTPMRRVHEGVSLDDFLRLVREVDSAIASQQSEK